MSVPGIRVICIHICGSEASPRPMKTTPAMFSRQESSTNEDAVTAHDSRHRLALPRAPLPATWAFRAF